MSKVTLPSVTDLASMVQPSKGGKGGSGLDVPFQELLKQAMDGDVQDMGKGGKQPGKIAAELSGGQPVAEEQTDEAETADSTEMAETAAAEVAATVMVQAQAVIIEEMVLPEATAPIVVEAAEHAGEQQNGKYFLSLESQNLVANERKSENNDTKFMTAKEEPAIAPTQTEQSGLETQPAPKAVSQPGGRELPPVQVIGGEGAETLTAPVQQHQIQAVQPKEGTRLDGMITQAKQALDAKATETVPAQTQAQPQPQQTDALQSEEPDPVQPVSSEPTHQQPETETIQMEASAEPELPAVAEQEPEAAPLTAEEAPLEDNGEGDELSQRPAESTYVKPAPQPANPREPQLPADMKQTRPIVETAPTAQPTAKAERETELSRAPQATRQRTAETEKTFVSESAQQPQDTGHLRQEVRTGRPEPAQPQSRAYASQAEQIQQQVTENLEKGRSEFRMQLEPNDLGKIDVKLVLDNGSLAVEILAANSKTAELLTRQTEALANTLRGQNVDVQSIQIVQQSGESSGHMESAFNMHNGQTQDNWRQNDSRAYSGRSDGASGDEDGSDSRETAPPAGPSTLLNTTI